MKCILLLLASQNLFCKQRLSATKSLGGSSRTMTRWFFAKIFFVAMLAVIPADEIVEGVEECEASSKQNTSKPHFFSPADVSIAVNLK